MRFALFIVIIGLSGGCATDESTTRKARMETTGYIEWIDEKEKECSVIIVNAEKKATNRIIIDLEKIEKDKQSLAVIGKEIKIIIEDEKKPNNYKLQLSDNSTLENNKVLSLRKELLHGSEKIKKDNSKNLNKRLVVIREELEKELEDSVIVIDENTLDAWNTGNAGDAGKWLEVRYIAGVPEKYIVNYINGREELQSYKKVISLALEKLK